MVCMAGGKPVFVPLRPSATAVSKPASKRFIIIIIFKNRTKEMVDIHSLLVAGH